MILYPNVQAKAYQEIVTVVGQDRLPEFSDQPHLPYVNAILLELLRWQPIAPLGAWFVAQIVHGNS